MSEYCSDNNHCAIIIKRNAQKWIMRPFLKAKDKPFFCGIVDPFFYIRKSGDWQTKKAVTCVITLPITFHSGKIQEKNHEKLTIDFLA